MVTFSGWVLQFLINGNGILKTKQKIQHIQAQSFQASHSRPRIYFNETIHRFKIDLFSPKKTLTLLYKDL